MNRKAALTAPALAASAFLVLHHLGRTWGATPEERRGALPGDEVVADPDIQTTHATTIRAAPGEIWPWLVQMGWHQGGWYTARWVDRLLFPVNWPAATRIIPELQGRAVGDFIPDGPPESDCGFVVERLDPAEALVLHSTTHLPMSWRRAGAWLDWTWTFCLTDLGEAGTRLVFRCRGRTGPSWVLGLYHLVIVPSDFVMSRQMLHGIRTGGSRARGPTMADRRPFLVAAGVLLASVAAAGALVRYRRWHLTWGATDAEVGAADAR